MSRDGFIERWSRRKLSRGGAEEPEPQTAGAPVADAKESEEPVEETLDEAELARLPALDTFTLNTDLAPFLRRGVPDALRNAAMRKMWMLDPAIRDYKDCAVDYAWDWNVPGGVPGNAGTISRDSLARMIDSLHCGPETREPTAPVAEAESAPSVLEVRAEPEAPLHTSHEGPDESVSARSETASQSDETARPRRHGGAAPV